MKKMKAFLALALALCTGLAFAPAKTVFAEGETTDPTLTGEEREVEMSGYSVTVSDPCIYVVQDETRTNILDPSQEFEVVVDYSKVPAGKYVKHVFATGVVGRTPDAPIGSESLGDFAGAILTAEDDVTLTVEFGDSEEFTYDLSAGEKVQYELMLASLFENYAVESTTEYSMVDINGDEVVDAKVYFDGTMEKAKGATGTAVLERPGHCYSKITLVLGEKEKEPTYELINDDNTVTTFTEGSDDEGVSFHIDGDYDQFDALLVDGKQVNVDGKTALVEPGSTIVILTKEFLATLGAGEHKVEVIYKNGKTVTATFTIKAAAKAAEVKAAETTTEAKNDSVKTGDDMLFVFPLMAFAVMGILALGVSMKKKED